MSDDRARTNATLTAARELSGALRDLARAMGAMALSPEEMRRAAAEVRAVTAGLSGPVRPRWYEESGDDPALDVPGRGFRHHSMFSGELNPVALRLRWAERVGPDGQPGLTAHLVVDELHEGPPRSVHGGYVAGLFDELLGGVQALADGGGGYTGKLTVWYRALTPLDVELELHGWITHSSGRRILARGRCTTPGGALTAEAEGLFIRPRPGLLPG